jgi:hypothetical protein
MTSMAPLEDSRHRRGRKDPRNQGLTFFYTGNAAAGGKMMRLRLLAKIQKSYL